MEIIVVPVAHVSEESVKKVKETIKREKPNVVAVELDVERFNALVHKKRPRLVEMIRHPFLAALYIFQQAFGRGFGITPGSEMLAAVETAHALKVPVAFVDRPIGITAAKLSGIPLKEKLYMLFQLLLSPLAFISNPFVQSRAMTEVLAQEELLVEFFKEFKHKLPNTFKVLVEERDEYIFNNVMRLDAEKVVLVIGAGHIPGIKKRIEALNKPLITGVAG